MKKFVFAVLIFTLSFSCLFAGGKEKPEESAKPAEEKKVEEKGEKKDKQAKGESADDFKTKQLTDFIANNLPEDVEIDILSDQSIFIENAVNESIELRLSTPNISPRSSDLTHPTPGANHTRDSVTKTVGRVAPSIVN